MIEKKDNISLFIVFIFFLFIINLNIILVVGYTSTFDSGCSTGETRCELNHKEAWTCKADKSWEMEECRFGCFEENGESRCLSPEEAGFDKSYDNINQNNSIIDQINPLVITLLIFIILIFIVNILKKKK